MYNLSKDNPLFIHHKVQLRFYEQVNLASSYCSSQAASHTSKRSRIIYLTAAVTLLSNVIIEILNLPYRNHNLISALFIYGTHGCMLYIVTNMQASLPYGQHGHRHGIIIGKVCEFYGECSCIHIVRQNVKLCDFEVANCFKSIDRNVTHPSLATNLHKRGKEHAIGAKEK